MSVVGIREQRDDDAPAVWAAVEAAFRGKPYSNGREHLILDALWKSGGAVIALVAESDADIVGQIAFSAIAIEARPSNWHCLGPIAVVPERQRQGIGTSLIREGMDRLRALGSAGCLVVGDPGYYERFGFRQAAGLDVADVPSQFVLAFPFDDAVPSGRVSFHEAFGLGP